MKMHDFHTNLHKINNDLSNLQRNEGWMGQTGPPAFDCYYQNVEKWRRTKHLVLLPATIRLLFVTLYKTGRCNHGNTNRDATPIHKSGDTLSSSVGLSHDNPLQYPIISLRKELFR